MKFENPQNTLSAQQDISGSLAWRSPSNIAIVKYWGKHGVQLPRNPNISLTLNNAATTTHLHFSRKAVADNKISLAFLFEGKENETFRLKQVRFLESLVPMFPFLTQLDLRIESSNSFPHSSGIASSASSMSALAMCLCDLEKQIFGEDTEGGAIQKASYIARLGSGSACRSIFPTAAIWGVTEGVEGSSDEWALGFEAHIDPVFQTFHDDILIASRSEKSVSSRMGHGLMDGNPYAEPRYAQARSRQNAVLAAMKSGDIDVFGQILEDEALTLHALMMTSSPSFTLLKPNTLKMIEILRGWRETEKLPVYFSLDAGPNLHLIYPDSVKLQAKDLIENALRPLCEDGLVIEDIVGKGATKLV